MDGPAKGCDAGPDARRRVEDREPDKTANVASSPVYYFSPWIKSKLDHEVSVYPVYGYPRVSEDRKSLDITTMLGSASILGIASLGGLGTRRRRPTHFLGKGQGGRLRRMAWSFAAEHLCIRRRFGFRRHGDSGRRSQRRMRGGKNPSHQRRHAIPKSHVILYGAITFGG